MSERTCTGNEGCLCPKCLPKPPKPHNPKILALAVSKMPNRKIDPKEKGAIEAFESRSLARVRGAFRSGLVVGLFAGFWIGAAVVGLTLSLVR